MYLETVNREVKGLFCKFALEVKKFIHFTPLFANILLHVVCVGFVYLGRVADLYRANLDVRCLHY